MKKVALLFVRAKARKGWCDMNKIIKTVAVLMAGMVLMAGTAVTAPHHGGHRPHCPPPPPPRHHVVHHVHHGGHEPDGLPLARRQSARWLAD